MRLLSSAKETKLRLLTENAVSLTLIEPTATGLDKFIMDATGPVRNYLKVNDFHNYEVQLQGPNHKVIKNEILF